MPRAHRRPSSRSPPSSAPSSRHGSGRCIMTTVVVHTTEGISYEGLMVLEHEKGLMLRSPRLLDENHSPVAMAGELWISTERVHAVQTVPERHQSGRRVRWASTVAQESSWTPLSPWDTWGLPLPRGMTRLLYRTEWDS